MSALPTTFSLLPGLQCLSPSLSRLSSTLGPSGVMSSFVQSCVYQDGICNKNQSALVPD